MSKFLITSGCSFTDNVLAPFENESGRWPHFLAAALNKNLLNYGHGSAGNDYICNSTIYVIQKLLNKKVEPQDIQVVVMWSGIDRQGHFISKVETENYESLINQPGYTDNPINYLEMRDHQKSGIFTPVDCDRGWLLGSPACTWKNKNIMDYKKLYFQNFYTYENCLYNSFNYFLHLQWFCDIHNISLSNLTFKEIIPINLEKYTTVSYLYDMINFNNWIFYDKNKGLYEYTRDNKLNFYHDNFHPTPSSHKNYVENFLLSRL